MKYRIAMSLVVVAILAALAFLFEDGGQKRPSFQQDQSFDGAKNFKIN